jgi:hypothetical protein
MGLMSELGGLVGVVGGVALGTSAGAVGYGIGRLSGKSHAESAKQFGKVTSTVFVATHKTGRAVGAVGDVALTVVTLGASPPPSLTDFGIGRK